MYSKLTQKELLIRFMKIRGLETQFFLKIHFSLSNMQDNSILVQIHNFSITRNMYLKKLQHNEN